VEVNYSPPDPVSGGPAPDQGTDAAAELARLRAEADAARTARDLAMTELLALHDAITRVVAVCDMAEWAAESDGATRAAALVQVADIRRALRPQT
jgi:hypothetical protein